MVGQNEKILLECVLAYHKRGWCMIPIPYRKKEARIRWGKYQQVRPDEQQLRRWFSSKLRNIAVVLGEVSNGLACRDFDAIAEYQLWAQAYPELAELLPTAQTSKGMHVYFEGHFDGIRRISNGELRGSRGYCLLPPSLHPDGTLYEWVNPLLNGNLLAIEPEDAGFLTNNSDVTERTDENRGEYRRMEEIEVEGIIEKLIIETLPKALRTRHRRVFDFA